MRALAAGVLTAIMLGCGGASDPPPAADAAVDSGSGSGGRLCTTIGCENGVHVVFSYRDPGDYVFEVTVDGVSSTCKATLPLPRTPFEACDSPDVLLGLVGSMLPANQQSIGGLILPNIVDAKSITVRGTRDGALLGDKTFSIAYRVTPGPNGPGCDPAECKLASVAFP